MTASFHGVPATTVSLRPHARRSSTAPVVDPVSVPPDQASDPASIAASGFTRPKPSAWSFGAAARPSVGLFTPPSRAWFVSVDDAQSSAFTRSEDAGEAKSHAPPPASSAWMTSAAAPDTRGAAIEVPCRFA